MSKASELNKFTKKEIIWALGHRYGSFDNTISQLINEIEQKRNQEWYKKYMQICQQNTVAMKEYFNFCNQMLEKYGRDENGFLLGDLTSQELSQLSKLKSKWDDLEKQEAKFDAEERRQIKKSLKNK